MDVTGFLSILIVLLYTMIASGWVPIVHGVTVSMALAPHSKALPRANREDAVIVGILRDGKIYFDTQLMMNESELVDHLRDRVLTSREKTVYVKVDARARYGAVNHVIAALQLAGIQKVAFITGRRSRHF
jgi:biopolymer transport protein ExbD